MLRRFLLPLIASLLLAGPAAAQVAPDKALKTFKVSEGLELSLWAHEPLCVNPTCMDIDHKGRVWYCESINYRQMLRGEKKLRRPEGDAIVILEDTKGKGKADKRTVFYQAPDFIAPLGIAVAPYPDGKGCKVYVCHSPHIYVFEDKDGDGKADGPPKILLTGFNGHDHDHGVHGISIGPDNKLYFSVGDTGVKDLQSSDKKGRKWTSNNTDCRAGTIWRCDLDGKNLELIAHNFRNNYEPAVDSFGTIFISDNDDDGSDQTRICFVMPGGNYGYHPRGPGQTHWHEEQPGVVPKVLRTFRGSPTGMCFYEGTLLPKKYWGQPLHTDAGPGRLSCYHLKEKGAGYDVQREDIVTSSDSWFRPSGLRVAPDGAVFVCDWYDPGVGGHGIGDFTRGRIYRVAPKGSKPSVPATKISTEKEMLHALASPNMAVRAMAMAKVTSMGNEGADVVREPAQEEKSAVLRARCLWLDQRIGREDKGVLGFAPGTFSWLGALVDKDPRFRVLAFRTHYVLSSPRDFDGPEPERTKEDAKPFHDKSAAVRREMLLLSQRIAARWAKAPILELAKQYDGKDRIYLAAIGIAVGHPGISREIDERRAIILKDFNKHFPEWNDKVAGLVWELRPPGMLPMLEKHLGNEKLPLKQRLQIVDAIAAADIDLKINLSGPEVLVRRLPDESNAEVRDHILRHLKAHIHGRWAGMQTAKITKEAADKLFKQKATREAGLELIQMVSGRLNWQKDVLKLAANKKQPLTMRLALVRTLGSFRMAAPGVLADIARDRDAPEELRVAAMEAMGQTLMERLQAQVVVAAVVDSGRYPLPVRRAAAAAMATEPEHSLNLLNQYTQKRLPDDLVADVTRLLRNSPFPKVRKEAERVLPPPPKLDPKKLPSIPALLTRRGSSDRGRHVLLATLKNDAQCLRCHTVEGVGGKIGPDLSSIGAKASRENLLESILYPSKAIAHSFESWIVETKGGLNITGLIVEDADNHILLRDATGKDFKIAKKEIDSKKKSPVSLMPDDLILHIPEQELLDMVEYLYGLKGQGFAPTGKLEVPAWRFALAESLAATSALPERWILARPGASAKRERVGNPYAAW